MKKQTAVTGRETEEKSRKEQELRRLETEKLQKQEVEITVAEW